MGGAGAVTRKFAITGLLVVVASVAAAQNGAPTDWLGVKPSTVEQVDRSLLGGDRRVLDRSFRALTLDASAIVHDIVWAGDAAHVYVLESDGTLRKLTAPEFREVRRLKLSARCGQLAVSKYGLVALLPDLQEIVLIAPTDLSVLRRIKVNGATRVGASPSGALAMVQVGEGGSLAICNLAEGHVVRVVSGALNREFQFPNLTADSQYLFSVESFGRWTRFRIVGDAIAADGKSYDLDSNVPCVMDRESKSVIMQKSGTQSRPPPGHPPVGVMYGLYVYPVGNLERPAVGIADARLPAAFDNVNTCFYASSDNSLRQHALSGLMEKDYAIGRPLGMWVDPKGRGVLVRVDRTLFWTTPAADATAGQTTPQVTRCETPLESDRRTVKGTTFVTLSLQAGTLVGEVLWKANGSGVLVLSAEGVIRDVSLGDKVVEVASVRLPGRCSWLSRAQSGLLVRVDDRQEALVLDEKTYAVKKRIALPGSGRLVASPSAPIAVAQMPENMVAVIDLDAGIVGATTPRLQSMACPVISQDAKYVFTTTHNRQFTRYALDGLLLRKEEDSPEFGHPYSSEASAVTVSADSRYVTLPTPSKISAPSYFPDLGGAGLYVFRSDRLASPALSIRAGHPVTAAAFDVARGRIYFAQSDGTLAVCDGEGRPLGDWKLPAGAASALWVRPGGDQLIAVAGDALYWVKPGATGAAEQAGMPSVASDAPVSLAGATRKVDDISVTSVKLSTEYLGSFLTDNFLWADGGQYVLIAETTGAVRKVAVPELIQTRAAALEGGLGSMAMSAAGLVVTVPGRNEVQVLDARTLEPRRRLILQGVGAVAASPGSKLAFLHLHGKGVAVLDAERGRIVRTLDYADMRLAGTTPPAGTSPPATLDMPRCTPDGRYVLSMCFDAVNLFEVRGSNLVHLGGSPRFPNRRTYWIGSGGKQVFVEGQLQTTSDGFNANGLTVYDLPNLMTPSRVIATPSRDVRAVDPVTGDVYTQLESGELVTVRPPRPDVVRKYTLTTPRQYERIAVSPKGGSMFVCAGRDLLWIEPGDRKPGRDPAALAKAEAEPRPTAAPAPPEPRAPLAGPKPGSDWVVDNSTRLPEPGGIVKNRRPAGRAQISELDVDAPNVLPCMVWAADGPMNALVLTGQGLLRRIDLKNGTLVKSAHLGAPCKAMAVARGGIVVARADMPVALILDPVSFDVRFKVPVEGLGALAATPALGAAFATSGNGYVTAIDTLKGVTLYTHHLEKSGKPVDLPADPPGAESWIQGVGCPMLTADGRYFLCHSIIRVHRFKVGREGLTYDGCSVQTHGQGIALSTDSALVATIQDSDTLNLPKCGPYGTYVFSVTDLKKPIRALRADSYANPVAVDSRGEWVYFGESGPTLGVYNSAGKKMAGLELRGGSPLRQILVEPAGRRVLALTAEELLWVDMKEGF